VFDQLYQRLGEVFDMYDEAIQTGIDEIKEHKRSVKALKLDLLKKTGNFELFGDMEETIDRLGTKTDPRHLKKMLKESRSLREQFIAAVASSAGVSPPPSVINPATDTASAEKDVVTVNGPIYYWKDHSGFFRRLFD